MLDELREVQEYMFDPRMKEAASNRIKPSEMYKGSYLSGVSRIMTMISRYFLFADNEGSDMIVRRAEAALRMWTGNTPLDYVVYRENKTYGLEKEEELAAEYAYLAKNYPWLNWWFPTYLREWAADKPEEVKSKIENIIKTLQLKKTQFGRSVFARSISQNDYKMLSYEKVIANAFSAYGPLRRYYLACEDPDWCDAIRDNKKKALCKTHPDRVIKIIAAYLIERSRKIRSDSALRFEPVNYTDVSNWTTSDTRTDKGILSKYYVEGRPLFNCMQASSKNQAKIKPDEKWFNESGWTLIEATDDDDALDEYLATHPGAVFYRDNGGRVPPRHERAIREVRPRSKVHLRESGGISSC